MNIFPLNLSHQTYAWGKLGTQSAVAQLLASAATSAENAGVNAVKIDENTPYAELWMGTHPNGPSTLQVDGKRVLLGDYVREHASKLLGEHVAKRFDNDVPFLFKVLSVRKALSIQAHPNKELAAKLHAERPDVYKDANHKPETAIALTDFEGLCSFRPPEEIYVQLKETPELAVVCGVADVESVRAEPDRALRDMFGTLMRQDDKICDEQLGALLKRIEAMGEQCAPLYTMVRRVARQYERDRGIFCCLLLNYVRLAPGDGLFLAANEPHAYLQGDIVECMARSDNVVRAGLTPKLKDVPTLCSMLTYRAAKPNILSSIAADKSVSGSESAVHRYESQVEEFEVSAVGVRANRSITLARVDGPSILLCVAVPSGVDASIKCEEESFNVCCGRCFFVAHGMEVVLDARIGGDGGGAEATKRVDGEVRWFRAAINQSML